MNRRPLPIGVDDFEKVIRGSYYYIDKTLFIKEILDIRSEVMLFTRPRRFGKTLNLSMLRCFLENREGLEDIFSGTQIMKAGEKYRDQQNRFPVIMITLKSMKQMAYEESFYFLKEEISREYKRHDEIVDRLPYAADRERFLRFAEKKAAAEEYLGAIRFLSECLTKCYGEKTVILIDEYDVPLENAYFNGFYDRMAALVRSLFESALKTNENLEFAVITGCLRISRESIFTGLNNLNIFSVSDDICSEYFGFTQKEVDQMLMDYGIQEQSGTVCQWYDGYCFGQTAVYNPWSVLHYVQAASRNSDALPRPYWSNTSSNHIVRRLIEKADLSVKQEIERLIEGKSIIKAIHEDITYEDVESTQDNLWNFLFFTGYLKKIREYQEAELIYMELAIPNREVRYIYKNTVLRWFEERTDHKDLSDFYESILNGDTQKMSMILSENLMETISFYDYQESYYHGFLAGMLKNVRDYIVLSNRESGCGRPDLLLKYPSIRGKAVIIEIKVASAYREMEKKCEEALRQIEDRNYEMELKEEGYRQILKYGIAFYRKECMVKKS